ncbi:hypothetical protein GQ53DRAFT_417931 [Thozetella sp. PMI_491]|nr:hypothetical protein GQ53DRAFT_417931 [Thozetella sp. PMI_491]
MQTLCLKFNVCFSLPFWLFVVEISKTRGVQTKTNRGYRNLAFSLTKLTNARMSPEEVVRNLLNFASTCQYGY